jgi:hypothetical protein
MKSLKWMLVLLVLGFQACGNVDKLVELKGPVHFFMVDMYHSDSIYVIGENGKRIRVVVPDEVKKKIWEVSPWDLKREGKTVAVDLMVLKTSEPDVFELKSVNSINPVDGIVSISQ